MLRRLAVAAIALVASTNVARGQGLDGHPFRTLSPETMPWGAHVIETGAEYRTSVAPQPLLSPQEGDLLRVPEIRYRMGFGRAEMSIGAAAWQFFSPDSKTLDDQSENGDVSIWFSVAARRPPPGGLAVGLAVGLKLPNASDETGTGTDEQDAFLAVLLGQRRETSEWRLNVGFAMLGDPLDPAAQEDVFTYALAGKLGKRHCFAWEVYGRAFSGDNVRDLEESTLEAGYLFEGRRISAEFSLLVGLHDNSGDLGASTGVAWKLGEAVQ